MRHHKHNYPGEHEAIWDTSIFDAVEGDLAARLKRENRTSHKSQAPLRGPLFDSNGMRMIPSHANKSGLRYCYYQSWVLNQGQKEKAGVVTSYKQGSSALSELIVSKIASEPKLHA